MRDFTPVDAREREILETVLDRNLLVEASAGSGKTEALARRMAAGLASGAWEPEHVAAVTFTRQAASELRGRLQIRLEARLESAAPAEQVRVREALSRLEHMFTGTIHAFCARLLRERPVEAGLTPGFRELEEGEDRTLALQSFRRHLDSLGPSEGGRWLRELALAPWELEAAFLEVCGNPDVDFPAEDQPLPDLAPVREAVRDFRTELGRLCPRFQAESRCKLQQQVRSFLGRTHVVPRNLGRLAMALAELEPERPATPKWWDGGKPAAEEAREAVARFRAAVALPFLEQVRLCAYAPLMRLLLGARQAWARDRGSAGLLNYGDLLLRAATLLRERPDVREALGRKFRWILVDEFQDTDPVQAEVLLWLASEPGPGTDWTRAPLRPGALFVVGDPKQSIYRFRRADISIYRTVRERIGEVLTLTQSFRSRPEICEWANRAFRDLLPPQLTEVQAPFAPLVPLPAEPARGHVGTGFLSVPIDVSWAGAVAREDSRAVAGWIAGEIRSGRRKPGDFLLLTRNKPRIPTYARALGDLGIPVEAAYAGRLSESPVRRAVLDLLRVLVDADDPIRVVAALRGPLFGTSDDELHRHVEAGGHFRVASEPLRGEPTVVATLSRLHAMVRKARQESPAAAVETVLEETGALAWAAAESVGGSEAGQLLDVVDRVRQALERGGSLAEAVASLEDEVEDGPRDRPARPLEPGRRDVVRIMNLHVAKGLEAPVVILTDPAGGFVFEPTLRVVREGSRARGYMEIASSRNFQRRVLAWPPDWKSHLAEEKRYCEAERHRLLYVAATRARELLVLSRVEAHDPPPNAWGELLRLMRGSKDLEWTTRSHAGGGIPSLDPGADAEGRQSRREAALRPTWSREAVTATMDEQREVVLRLLERPSTSLGVDGAAWGSLVHRLLEAALSGSDQRADLERLARWHAFETPELEDLIPEALDLVQRVLDSDFGRRVRSAPHLVEVPFAVRRQGGALVFGIVDLAVQAPEGWQIVDWKTDRRRLADLVALYGPQVQEYARAWEGLTGRPVAYRGLYGVVEGELSEDCLPGS